MKYFLLIITICLAGSCKEKGLKDHVQAGDRVQLAFKLKTVNHIRIDESFFHNNFDQVKADEVFAFTAGNQEVIPGWDSVIIGCKTDTLYTFRIPYQQAYGEETIYHDIPAKSDLILTFKIFDIQ